MSERNRQLGRADGEEIAVPALTGMRYLARTSPPIPDAAMQEAHWPQQHRPQARIETAIYRAHPDVTLVSFLWEATQPQFGAWCQVGSLKKRPVPPV
jgi:hypothetical protein